MNQLSLKGFFKYLLYARYCTGHLKFRKIGEKKEQISPSRVTKSSERKPSRYISERWH
jgi:hypothetical protein